MAFMIEDIINLQSQYNIRQEYTREAGYALARDIDNQILGLRADIQGFNAQSNVVYVSSTGAVGGTPLAFNRAGLLAAIQILDEADVPREGRKLIISPGQVTDIMTIQEFISSDYVNNKPTATGMIGTLYGIPVMVSNNLRANSATGYMNGDGGAAQPTPGFTGSPYFPSQALTHFGVAVTATSLDAGYVTAILVHHDAFILAMQLDPKVENSRENLFQADAVVSTMVYGSKTFRPDHAVNINTAA